MNKDKEQIVYEGKAKKLYLGSAPNTLIQYFKDDATAFNAKKHDVINMKGVINNFISEYLMLCLERKGIPTHLIKRINQREQLIKKVNIIPIEVVVRNIGSGSIIKRYGIKEGLKFSKPLIEFFLKDDNLNDPLVNENHIKEFNLANNHELKLIKHYSIKINKILKTIFNKIDIELIDFKLEFGKYKIDNSEKLILADEISPDNCRLWDKSSFRKLDKDIFRKNLGNLLEGYKEVAKRLKLKLD